MIVKVPHFISKNSLKTDIHNSPRVMVQKVAKEVLPSRERWPYDVSTGQDATSEGTNH